MTKKADDNKTTTGGTTTSGTTTSGTTTSGTTTGGGGGGSAATTTTTTATTTTAATTAATPTTTATTATTGVTAGSQATTANFTDLVSGAWYQEYVDYVVANGLMSGVDTNSFSPNTSMTRAMVMTVLARMDGTDTAVTDGSAWYTKAMNWSISKNVSDGSNPNGNITREQLVTMLWRYAGEPTATADLSGFGDSAKISDYAKTAMQWAAANGFIGGDTDKKLNPTANSTRAEVSKILALYHKAQANNASAEAAK
jgi:hypothetical protein